MKVQKIKLQMVKEPNALYTAEKITSPQDIVELVNKYERYDLSPTEKFIVVGLNTKNKVNIYTELVSGSVDSINVSMSDIFKVLATSNSNKFIVAHNHPSGDTEASKEDIVFSEKIKKASELLGIELLDHIIIADNSYKSLKKEGYMN